MPPLSPRHDLLKLRDKVGPWGAFYLISPWLYCNSSHNLRLRNQNFLTLCEWLLLRIRRPFGNGLLDDWSSHSRGTSGIFLSFPVHPNTLDH
ncbi:hypothetical protein ADUPG1_013911 [Aduncisulcus paluster]|uniref:Uncharacterized protein n=1 Tax=Aduncisulcus paluster TaxID=2918883 RepID=A0ABQ5K4U5_9EUKA|nr:hypothetical protein ADUPG1_013911 [Aduncisulcus paluster]